MSDLKIILDKNDPNFGDLALDDNDLVLVDGKAAILQHILQRLRTFYGEWFLDVTVGVPYFQQILVKNPKKSDIDALFVDVILGTPGVEELSAYSFDANVATRLLRISFRAATTDGPVDYAGLVTA